MPPHETPRLTFSGLQTIVSYNCLKCNRISSFRGDAKHRTRNLEIPRCAIAHLRSGPSDHSGMTAQLERFRAKWAPVRVKKTRQNKNLEPPFRFNRNGKGSRPP